MSFLRRTSDKVETTQKSSESQVASRLLAQALEATTERTECINVLDLSGGSSGTVSFFSNLECPTHLIFADCQDLVKAINEADANKDGPLPFTQRVALCRAHLALPKGSQLDLILIWDFLHYFNKTTLEALSNALQPHIHHATRGYGFGSLHSDRGIKAYNYAIASENSIFMHSKGGAASTLPYAHSQQQLTENFVCLRIGRGTLLQEGHLELLLEP